MTPNRERSSDELAEDFAELKSMLVDLGRRLDRLDEKFLSRELYEARHKALRTEVAIEMAAIKTTAESARTLSMWALGVLIIAVVGAIVTFAVSGAA